MCYFEYFEAMYFNNSTKYLFEFHKYKQKQKLNTSNEKLAQYWKKAFA